MRLLGRFRIKAAGKTVIDHSWPQRKAKAIVKLLALQHDHTLHREQLMETLWPDLDAEAAARNLRKSLYHLRAAFAAQRLPPPFETPIRDTLVLGRKVCVDVDAFRDAAAVARGSAADPYLYETALSLYQSDLLPEDIYEDWTTGARERLVDERLQLMLELACIYLRAGPAERAIHLLQDVVQIDPLREEGHRALMQAFAGSGDCARGIRQYLACRQALQQELGLEPSEETRALYDQIVGLQRLRAPAGPSRTVWPPPQEPQIRYTTTRDGVRIAYCTLGQGPPLVSMPWMPHGSIEIELREPAFRSMHELQARTRMLVRYDGRGTGLSDRDVYVRSLEDVVLDLESVVDALRLQAFALLGGFNSGPAAIAYAVRHPERVSHLVLWSTYASGREFFSIPVANSMLIPLETDWMFYTEASAYALMGFAEPDLVQRGAAWMRNSTTQQKAIAYVNAMSKFDVEALLPRVRCPTLVVHRPGIPWGDPKLSRTLASGIPGATLISLQGEITAPLLPEHREEMARLIEGFCT